MMNHQPSQAGDLRLGGAAPALAQQSLEETLNDVRLACWL